MAMLTSRPEMLWVLRRSAEGHPLQRRVGPRAHHQGRGGVPRGRLQQARGAAAAGPLRAAHLAVCHLVCATLLFFITVSKRKKQNSQISLLRNIMSLRINDNSIVGSKNSFIF